MQQPAPTLEKISDLIACAVCLEVVKNPRLLPCQHSFCLACLSQIRKNESISCPLCRINHDIPDAAKLPVDFMKNSLLEIVEQEKRAGPIRPKIWYCTSCDESEHEEAVGYCEECKEYLCMDHQKVHAKDKNTKTHQITPVEKKAASRDAFSNLGLSFLNGFTEDKRYCVVQKLRENRGSFMMQFTICAEGASYLATVTLRAKEKVVVNNLDVRGQSGGSVSVNKVQFEYAVDEEMLRVLESHANIEVLMQTIDNSQEKRSIVMPLLREETAEIPGWKEKESILLSVTSDVPRPVIILDEKLVSIPAPVFPQSYARGNEEPACILIYRRTAFHVQALQKFNIFIDSNTNPFPVSLSEAALFGVKPEQPHVVRVDTEGYDKILTTKKIPPGHIHVFEVYLWWFSMEVQDHGVKKVSSLYS